MSSPTTPPEIALDIEPRPQLATLGWALRRAGLGLLILLVMIVLFVWLFHASIEPDEAAAATSAQSGYAAPQR